MLGFVRRLGFDATDPKVRKILYLHETSLAIVAKCGHPMGHPKPSKTFNSWNKCIVQIDDYNLLDFVSLSSVF
jgi:hypothetical protein